MTGYKEVRLRIGPYGVNDVTVHFEPAEATARHDEWRYPAVDSRWRRQKLYVDGYKRFHYSYR